MNRATACWWVNTAQGLPLASAVTSDREGGALQVYNAQSQQLAYLGASGSGSGHLTLHDNNGALMVVAGEDHQSGLLMVNNAQDTNIFLTSADSALNGGLLINNQSGENLIYAGAGTDGHSGLHVNAANGTNLIFLGADDQESGAIGIWDRNGQSSVLKRYDWIPYFGPFRVRRFGLR